jgi:hypothetical protein
MNALLACGSMHFSPTQTVLLSLLVIAIYSTPVMALANLVMIFAVPLKRRATHLVVFGGCALLTLFVFLPGDTVLGWSRMVAALVVMNVVAGQFGLLLIKAWRARRQRARQV